MSNLPSTAGAIVLALILAFHPGPAALALAALALGVGLLPIPRRLTVLAFFAVAELLFAGPALAQAAGATLGGADPAPALTALLDRGAAWLIGGALSGIGVLLFRFGKVVLPAVVEARLRQTALTGAHIAIVEMEREIAHSWTPERIRLAVGKVVAWVMDRSPWMVARLGWSQAVVTGVATKMLAQALGGAAGPVPAPSLAGLAGAAVGAVLSDGLLPAAAACAACGAADAERLANGCTNAGCPQVPAALPGIAAAAEAALAVPSMLLSGGLAPADR